MKRRHIVQLAAATLAGPALTARAQAFPAGGPTDITMRSLADNASKILGQPVIVENKPGAGGTLPAQALQSAPADGYTVAQIPLGVFRLPYTTKINWDPVKDITYVLNVTGYAFGLVVPADSQLKTWTHFVAWAKANPGKLTYGSTGTMTSPHLTMELIAQKLNLELLHVPYKGSADLMQSILGGNIMAAADSTGFAPQVEAGKLRVLNTWGAERLTSWRFGLDWHATDYVSDTRWADRPTLVFHGDADTTVPIATSREFAAADPQVTLIETPGAEHVASWNVDPMRYENALRDFLAPFASTS